jgi:hypothetical protein
VKSSDQSRTAAAAQSALIQHRRPTTAISPGREQHKSTYHSWNKHSAFICGRDEETVLSEDYLSLVIVIPLSKISDEIFGTFAFLSVSL